VTLLGRYEELHGEVAASALDRLIARLRSSPPGMAEMPWQGAGVFVPETHAQRLDVMFRITIFEKTGRYDR
jgi:hypothetical protein